MEYWDVYDVQGNKTGRVRPKGDAFAPDERHLAMELWIWNSRGEVLLQKRADTVEILPGMWALTTGRMRAGEDGLSGCLREAAEELGLALHPSEPRLVRRILREGESMLWEIYRADRDIDPASLRLQPEEVSDVRWVSPETFREMVRRGELISYPEIFELLEEMTSARVVC